MKSPLFRALLGGVVSCIACLSQARGADAATVTVNAQTVVRTLDARTYGVNLSMWDESLMTADAKTLTTAMQMGSFRFPGGSLSDDYDWQTNKQISSNPNWTWVNPIPNFTKFIEAQGTNRAFVTVNYGSGTPEQAAALVAYCNGDPSNAAVLGVDVRNRDWKTVGFWAGLRAASPLATDDGYNFLRIAHPAPYGYKDWEVGNECYGSWEYDQHGSTTSPLGGAAHDGVTYAQAFQKFFTQMKAVDPSIRVGAVVTETEDLYGGTHTVTNPADNTTHKGWTAVVLSTLNSLGVTPDFVIEHYYPQNPGNESDAFLLQASSAIDRFATAIRKMLNNYLGGGPAAGIQIVMTELNSVSSDPGKQSVNLVNGLFYADCYGVLAQTEFKACLWWQLHNGYGVNNQSASLYGWRPFGAYDMITGKGFPSGFPENTPLPAFYAAKLLTHWARGGDQVLSTTSSSTLLSAYGAKLANGHLAILFVNKNPSTDITGQISLLGFQPGSTTATVYSYGKINDAQNSPTPDITSSTISNASSSFSYTFPSYSITVIDLGSNSGAPVLTALPVSQTVPAGGTATLTVTATSDTAVTYQWLKDGVALPGQTGASLVLGNVQAADAGAYTVKVTNSVGSTTSFRAVLAVGAGVRMINISLLATVGTGDSTPIVGFALGGSGQNTIVIQGVGPYLANFLQGSIADPAIALFDQAGVKIAQNDDWDGSAATSDMFARSGSFAFPVGSKDAALTPTLMAGPAYSVSLLPSHNTTGTGMAQFNALDWNSSARLVNISARSMVASGSSLTAGFSVRGDGRMDVLIRGVGSPLARWGITNYLGDPKLSVNDDHSEIAKNDDWAADAGVDAVKSVTARLALWSLDSKDSAVIVNVGPGNYTAVLSGNNGTSGVGLLEVYEVH